MANIVGCYVSAGEEEVAMSMSAVSEGPSR